MQEKQCGNLQERLANTANLSEAQKQDILSFFQKQQAENIDYFQANSAKTEEFLTKVAEDKTLTQDQRKEAIKQYFADLKKSNQEFRKTQQGENQQLKGSMNVSGSGDETSDESGTPETSSESK